MDAWEYPGSQTINNVFKRLSYKQYTPPLLKSIITVVNRVTYNFPPAKFPPTPPLDTQDMMAC